MLGPVQINIFPSYLLSTLQLSDLFNFADDNAISTTADNIDYLLLTLKHESDLRKHEMLYGKSNDSKAR